jgi:hypothetical protein
MQVLLMFLFLFAMLCRVQQLIAPGQRRVPLRCLAHMHPHSALYTHTTLQPRTKNASTFPPPVLIGGHAHIACRVSEEQSRWHRSGSEKRRDGVLELYELSPHVLSPKLARWKFEKDTNSARMMLSLSIATAGALFRISPHFTLRPLPRHGLCPHIRKLLLPPSERSSRSCLLYVHHCHGHGNIPRPKLI